MVGVGVLGASGQDFVADRQDCRAFCHQVPVWFWRRRQYIGFMTILPQSEIFDAARKAHFAVTLHEAADFEGMRRAGRLAAEVLDLLVPLVKPGVTTTALDKVAYDYVVSHDALPACLNYRGYRHTVCTSINHVVCHGIPNDKP